MTSPTPKVYKYLKFKLGGIAWMRKSFCALSIAVMVMHLFVLTGTACADDINERFEALYQRYDPNNDPDRINPSPLDGRISEGDSGRDAIISRKNAEEIRRTREASGRPDDPQTAPAPQTQQTTRRWQTGLQEWYSDEAKYQLTNWTFSKDKVTVELIDRRGKVIEKYTIRPYDPGHPEHGFQFCSIIDSYIHRVFHYDASDECKTHIDRHHMLYPGFHAGQCAYQEKPGILH